MRVLISNCDSCSFTGVTYVIVSWYKPQEAGRRVSLFFIAAPLGPGSLAGYLQAAAYTNLHSTQGWPGGGMFFKHARKTNNDFNCLDGCLFSAQSSPYRYAVFTLLTFSFPGDVF